jgi:hypothetical protein
VSGSPEAGATEIGSEESLSPERGGQAVRAVAESGWEPSGATDEGESGAMIPEIDVSGLLGGDESARDAVDRRICQAACDVVAAAPLDVLVALLVKHAWRSQRGGIAQ